MKNLCLLSLLLLSSSLFAQPVCQWAYIPVALTQSYNNIYNVATDHSGNIIELGKILGVADMDPGSGMADTSFSDASYNYYISKTSQAGELIWIHYFQRNSQIAFFEYAGLKINSANEIIVVGNFFGMVDFDLSDNGVDTLRSHFPTYPDYFVAKYDSTGSYQWAFNIGDPTTSNIEAQAVTILQNDDIVITANPNGTIDVDPDTNIVHNSIGGNANLICYDSNGNYLWNNHIVPVYSYGIKNNSLDCDGSGNSYLLSVGYYELTVSKFSNTGMNIWNNTIGNFPTGDRVDPQSVLVDKATGHFYVAGTFGGTVDFDPGVPVVNKTSSSGFFQDGFVAKYDQDMNLLWVNAYVGNVVFGKYSLDFDSAGIVAVGQLKGTIDFGSGNVFSSPAYFSPFYIKLDTAGISSQGFLLNGQGNYNTINIIPGQTFVTSGYITGNTDMDPTSVSYILNASSTQFFTAVYQTPVTSSLNESLLTDDFTAFPNPANTKIEFRLNSNRIGTEYAIFDCTGSIVSKEIIKNENTIIDTAKLAKGFYVLRVGENLNQTFKFIKE